jgi:type IV pilus assembly protein PilA
MVVVAVVGILSAIVIPQYLTAKESAEATTSIAETISIASQCAVAQKTQITETVSQPLNGAQRVCNGQANRSINSRQWSGNAAGVKCLGVTASSSHRRARITVTVEGDMSCQFI